MDETTPLINNVNNTVININEADKDDKDDKDEKDECVICMEKLNENIINLPCGEKVFHTFHKSCILANIEHTRNATNKTTCPTCRTNYSYSTNHNYTVTSNMVWYVLKYNLMVYYLNMITIPVNITAFIFAIIQVKNGPIKYIACLTFSLHNLLRFAIWIKSRFVIKWAKSKDYNLLRYGCQVPNHINMTSFLVLNLIVSVLYILCIFFPVNIRNVPFSLMCCSWIDALVYIGLFSAIFKEKKTLSTWLDKIFVKWRNVIKTDLDNVKFYLNVWQDHQCGHVCSDECYDEEYEDCGHECDCEFWKKIEL